MYGNDMEWMHRAMAPRYRDFLREAERERQFVLARQARTRPSWPNVARGAIAAAMRNVAPWLETGGATQDVIQWRPRAQSR